MSEEPGGTTVPRAVTGPAAASPRARLRVVFPAHLEAEVWLGTAPLVVGRRAGEDGLSLDEQTISRQHARFEWDAARGTHAGLDLGSRNGTTIDGVAVAGQRRPLMDNSLVRVGEALLIYERMPVLAGAAGTAGGASPAAPQGPSDGVSDDALPGDAAPVRALRSLLARAARDPAPALIIGQTGTGKERLAAELHRLSGRRGPLVPVNCAALTPQLMESQLFGHQKGAFTGAVDAQPGLFRAAAQGTLFLDEIGELPLDLQPKLLRAIQEGEVSPLGSTSAVRVDVRVVAATNVDLAGAVIRGKFRQDLYARLSPWELRVPPLYQRRIDLLMWLGRLHRIWAQERRLPPLPFALDADAAEAILRFAWPTNLRGLGRLIHELEASGSRGRPIGAADLPAWMMPGSITPEPETPLVGPPPAESKVPIPSEEVFRAAFAELQGNVRALGRHFGRDRRQIYRWMEAFGLRQRGDDPGSPQDG
jgi:DNA-binding NtrC family response regulator